MKKLSLNWPVKQFVKSMGNGVISFDYPIQREGSQWDALQKSLLIHSLAQDYPIPAMYSIVEAREITEGKKPVNVYMVLDGKQRLTNIRDYTEGLYALHEDTPNVAISDGIEETEYEMAGKIFDDLDEEVKDEILSYSLQIYKMEDISDEQIEDLFFRLNNGTPLSQQQKAKAKMGIEWAKKIQNVVDHELMQEKASFTKLQVRKADHETAILQTMMLIDGSYEWDSISSNEVFAYSQTFKGDNEKDLVVEKIISAMNYLNEAFDKKESLLLRKVNFPMTLITAMKAMDNDISSFVFSQWSEDFKEAMKGKEDGQYIKTDYKDFGGAGSVKKYKTLDRINSMNNHLTEYLKQLEVASAIE